MAAFFYPEIDHQTVKNLLILRQLVEEHAAYFLESPYAVSLESDIQALLKHTRHATSSAPAQEDEDIDVENELRTLFRGLKLAKPVSTDSDQMAYFRTSTALLEKLLGLQEKARNIKTMSEHHDLVLNFMEEICSPTQIEEFTKRLKETTV